MDDNSLTYYGALEQMSLLPGWTRTEPAIWPTPRPKFEPAIWYFEKAKAALQAAGQFVSTEQAERRNLIMVNPIEGNKYATSRNLVAAYQMIMPGERARTHRHSPSALRLIIDVGPDVYTVVDGARIDMANGDVVLTPGGCWHGHANDGGRPGYWIDFLDVPFAQHLEAIFMEWTAQTFDPPNRHDRQSPFRYASADVLGAGRGFLDVEIGRDHMPTIGLHLLRQPSGTASHMDRSTANNLYAVAGGRVRVEIEGGVSGVLGTGDLVSVPCWHAHSLHAEADATLLRVTDEPILKALGYLRTLPS
jgi:gentisate 1,2-dioxygenase